MEKKNKYKYQSLYLITKQSDSKYLLTLDYTSLCTTYKEIFISQKEENLLPGGSLYSKARNAWKNKKLRLRQELTPDKRKQPQQQASPKKRTRKMNSNYHHGQEQT